MTVEFEESWLYDNDIIFKVDPKQLKYLKNKEIKKCFFTNLNYSEEFLNDFCEVCLVSKIGVETLGMKIL